MPHVIFILRCLGNHFRKFQVLGFEFFALLCLSKCLKFWKLLSVHFFRKHFHQSLWFTILENSILYLSFSHHYFLSLHYFLYLLLLGLSVQFQRFGPLPASPTHHLKVMEKPAVTFTPTQCFSWGNFLTLSPTHPSQIQPLLLPE